MIPKRKVFVIPIIALDEKVKDLKSWYATKCAVVAKDKICAAYTITEHPNYDKTFRVAQKTFQETTLRDFHLTNPNGKLIAPYLNKFCRNQFQTNL